MRRSLKNEVATYLQEHPTEWCFISSMARNLLGSNSSSTRRTIRGAFNNARYVLESSGLHVIPKVEAGVKGVEAYKIASEEDLPYIVDNLKRINGRYKKLGNRVLKAFEIVKDQKLIPDSKMPAVSVIKNI